MAVFTVVRHSRADEESGQYELVGAAAIGRYAPFAASLVVACGASATTGLLAALGLAGLGFDSAGAVAFGLAVASIGCTFAAVTAIAAPDRERAHRYGDCHRTRCASLPTAPDSSG
jgi:polyether ionophore transport system permease protein